MDPERRRRAEEIFHRALEHAESTRAAFLEGACSDAEVRREVEALLEGAGGGGARAGLAAGSQLGPYRIEGPLGAGGMGTVYKALDTRLHRTVAIKMASERFTDRFEREARAIAALNHPYVCTLYDVGANYLVMEYVEGVSLRQLLKERPLAVDEALHYAMQIAAAMEAAHAAGVVHRDLKPGNVMVTAAGKVKVLDFGLAKLAQPAAATGESEATATIATETGSMWAGGIVGTPSYMSPEQALGKPLDARSDVFSFGALLYEMVTGQQAFRGESAIETLSGIIHLDPPPPSAAQPGIDAAMDSLVARCLRKDPAQRYATMAEVHRDLKGIVAERSGIFLPERKAPGARPIRWPKWGGAAAAALAVAAAGLALWRGWSSRTPEYGGAPEMVRVSSDAGLSIDPAISQDGRFVVFASDRAGEGNLDLWVKQLGGGDPIRLTRDPADDGEPNFSPDGTHIVFRSERDGGGLYIVPTTGGEERRIADGGRRPQYSPDGTKVVYWTGPVDPFPLRDGIGKIFVLDLVTSATRRIRADFTAAVHPVWSPDGKKILFVGAKESAASGKWDWWITPLEGGAAVPCPVMPPGDLFDPFAWQGNQVYFAWNGAELQTISRIAIDASAGRATSKPQRLSAVTADAFSPAVSKAGQVVFSVVDTATNLYALPLKADAGETTGAAERLSKEPGWNTVRSISADGTRAAFTSTRAGSAPQVWVRDLPAGRELALTEGGVSKAMPEISPDGRLVAWREASVAARESFVTPANGGLARKVCTDCGIARTWSPDGSLLLFDGLTPRVSIGMLDFASGRKTIYLQSKDANLVARSIASDGKWMAFTAEHSAVDFTVYVAPFAVERPPPESEWVKVAASPEVHPDPRWSPDGKLLYFSSERDGQNCIWALHLDPQSKRPQGGLFAVRHFHGPSLTLSAPSRRVPAIALARDKMVVSLRERSGGIWMLKLAGK